MNKNVRFGKISEDKLGLVQEKMKRVRELRLGEETGMIYFVLENDLIAEILNDLDKVYEEGKTK